MYCRSGSNETKSKDVKQKPHREKSGDRGRGRGRNRGPDIIQSHSIFEQGPSDKNVPKSKFI